MVLLKYRKIPTDPDKIAYTINESLRARRVDELKLPLILISTYFCAHWLKKPHEIVTILDNIETDIGADRIIDSIMCPELLSIEDRYETLSQRYSDYINFLEFNPLEQTTIRRRFTNIHEDFTLPKPKIPAFSKIKGTLLERTSLLELLLTQESEIARLNRYFE